MMIALWPGFSKLRVAAKCRRRNSNMTNSHKTWHLYLVRCADDTIYTGISIDVEARIEKHNSGRGAKYTQARLPVRLIYSESQPDRVSAMKREIAVKKWGRKRKESLAQNFTPPKPG